MCAAVRHEFDAPLAPLDDPTGRRAQDSDGGVLRDGDTVIP